MGELGIGVGHPRQGAVVDPGRQPEQRVADHDAGMIAADMGELRPADRIADREDLPVARAQPRVDLDAVPVVVDACELEVHALDLRRPARGDEQVRPLDARRPAFARQAHRDAVAGPLDRLDLDLLAQHDAVRLERAAHHRGQLRIILRQDRPHVEHGDRRAQPPVRLRHLAADRPAADHHQMIGRGAVVEDRLVGQIGRPVEARDRRCRRPAAGREHEPSGAHPHVARLDLVARAEARMGADHGHAQPLEALLAVDRGDRGDHAVHVIVNLPEVDLRLVAVDAEAAGMAHGVRGTGRREQRLGGHAAVVQAVAAHLAGLDQHRAGAHLAGAGGHRQAGGAAADDADVRLEPSGHDRMFPQTVAAGAATRHDLR